MDCGLDVWLCRFMAVQVRDGLESRQVPNRSHKGLLLKPLPKKSASFIIHWDSVLEYPNDCQTITALHKYNWMDLHPQPF